MASKRDDRKGPATDEVKAIDRAIEETKDTTRKVMQEVKRELPENTATFHDFQEQNINAVRDMTDSFLDSQKEVAKSMQSAYRPYTNNIFATMMFWPFSYMNPQVWTENYVKAATTMADATVAAARLQSDMMVAGLESTHSLTDYARRNTREFSKLNVENARTVEQLAQNAASSQTA